jgi:hypothetical protein
MGVCVMNGEGIDQTNAEDLTSELSDEALEAAAGNELARTMGWTFTTPDVGSCCSRIAGIKTENSTCPKMRHDEPGRLIRASVQQARVDGPSRPKC